MSPRGFRELGGPRIRDNDKPGGQTDIPGCIVKTENASTAAKLALAVTHVLKQVKKRFKTRSELKTNLTETKQMIAKAHVGDVFPSQLLARLQNVKIKP